MNERDRRNIETARRMYAGGGEETLLIHMEASPTEFETFANMGGQVLESVGQGK